MLKPAGLSRAIKRKVSLGDTEVMAEADGPDVREASRVVLLTRGSASSPVVHSTLSSLKLIGCYLGSLPPSSVPGSAHLWLNSLPCGHELYSLDSRVLDLSCPSSI